MKSRLIAVACLLLMFWMAIHSMEIKSPTMDEQGFLVRGLGLVRGENDWMRVGHPAGLNLLNASLLWRDEGVKLPTDHPSWRETSFHRPAELFLWEIGNDVEYVMFLARLPSVWLGMMLACVCGRFAFDMTRKKTAGLFALIMVAFDPNILAHTRLTTTDLGFTAGVVIGVYTLWLFLRQPSSRLSQRKGLRGAIIAGIGFAIMQNTKFTAGLFLPIFALIVLIGLIEQWVTERHFPMRKLVMLVTVYPLSAFVALWAMYGFDVGTLPETLPTFDGMLSGRTLPLARHIEQLSDLGGRMTKGTPAFLRGNYSDTGWWRYFPIVFALKTPLITLLMAFVGIRYIVSLRTWLDRMVLFIPPIAFFAFGMTNDINIGYRHILLVVPFIAIWGGVWIARLQEKKQWYTGIATILGVLLLLETVLIAPNFLAYFNPIAGGAENGWRSLVDSNIDWGQDLARLDDWMAENEVDEVRLSYFGEARPDYYNINYVGLPSSPPRLMRPYAITHYPPNPAPGIYAISATNLQGVLFDNHDEFAFFRDKEPIGHVGHSILLYEVEATGEPAALALGNMQLTDILPEEYAKMGTNDVRPSWFDATYATIVYQESQPRVGWNIFKDENRHPAVDSALNIQRLGNTSTFVHEVIRPAERLLSEEHYSSGGYVPIDSYEDEREIYTPFTDADGGHSELFLYSSYTFNGGEPYQWWLWYRDDDDVQYSDPYLIQWITTWQQKGTPTNIKMFMHIENKSGEIVAQWDGLGVVWDSWHEEDWLVQVMSARVPEEIAQAGGTFDVWFGVYDAVTGERWRVDGDGGNRYYAGEIILE